MASAPWTLAGLLLAPTVTASAPLPRLTVVGTPVGVDWMAKVLVLLGAPVRRIAEVEASGCEAASWPLSKTSTLV
jgi:hypothetical protein